MDRKQEQAELLIAFGHLLRPIQDLEALTQPTRQHAEADQRFREIDERFMNVRASFPADAETTEVVQPGNCPFHEPAIHAESAAMLTQTMRNDWGDPALT